jgi:hypothetical protein
MYEYKAIFSKLIKEAHSQKIHTFIFVVLIACVAGFVMPLFIGDLSFKIQIYSIAVFSIVLLRQWAAESFAAEKENHTLEALISTCIKIKVLFYTEVFFNFLLATIVEYILILIFAAANYFLGIRVFLEANEFILLLFIHFMIKLFISQRVTWISLLSKDVRTANSFASKYLFGTVFFISIIIALQVNEADYLEFIYGIFAVVGGFINVFTFIRISRRLDCIYLQELWKF